MGLDCILGVGYSIRLLAVDDPRSLVEDIRHRHSWRAIFVSDYSFITNGRNVVDEVGESGGLLTIVGGTEDRPDCSSLDSTFLKS